MKFIPTFNFLDNGTPYGEVLADGPPPPLELPEDLRTHIHYQ